MTKLAITMLLVLLLFGCKSSEETTSIGVISALTQHGADWGTEEKNAIELAVAEINIAGGIDGKQIKLIVEDSGTDPTKTITAYKKLTEVNGIKFIVGPTWEASTAAIAPLAAKENVLLISPSAYKNIQNQNSSHLFSTYPPYYYEIRGLIPFFEEHNMTRFVIIYHNEYFSELMKNFFVNEAEQNNWTISKTLARDVEDRDYRTSLLQLKNLNIDAIYAPLAVDDPDLGLLMKQMRELGINATVVSASSAENVNLLKNFATEIEGIIYPYPVETPAYSSFAEKYKQKYGELPHTPSAATAYDATTLLIDALKSGAETPEKVAKYLHNITDYQGASNVINFDEQGVISSKEHFVKTVKNGEFVEIEKTSE